MKTKADFEALSELLKKQGFTGYPGTTYPLPQEYANDYIFELSEFYLPLLMATREQFSGRQAQSGLLFWNSLMLKSAFSL